MSPTRSSSGPLRAELLALLALVSGCATLFASDKRQVYVDSSPRGAMVYAGSSEPEGPTPRWVWLDQDEDASVRVVWNGVAYVCDYSSQFALKWLLLDIPLLVPLAVDLFMGEGGELERSESDRYGPVSTEMRIGAWQDHEWRNDRGVGEGVCFADFSAVAASAAAPPAGPTIEVPALEAAQRKVAAVSAALDTRARTDILATVRRGPWLAINVHGGLGAPTGLAGGGLELGYSPRLSLELGIGADLDAFLRDGGPETSALLRGRLFSAGERWFGLGAGVVKSRGPSGPTSSTVDDPLWLAAEVFSEQPFTRFGLFRFGGGGKRVVDYDTCTGDACDRMRSELYVDLSLGFQL